MEGGGRELAVATVCSLDSIDAFASEMGEDSEAGSEGPMENFSSSQTCPFSSPPSAVAVSDLALVPAIASGSGSVVGDCGRSPIPLAAFPLVGDLSVFSVAPSGENWVEEKVMGLGQYLGVSVCGFESEVMALFLSIEAEWKLKGIGRSPNLYKEKKLRNELKRLESSVKYDAKSKGKGSSRSSDQ